MQNAVIRQEKRLCKRNVFCFSLISMGESLVKNLTLKIRLFECCTCECVYQSLLKLDVAVSFCLSEFNEYKIVTNH